MEAVLNPAVGKFTDMQEKRFYTQFATMFKPRNKPKPGQWLESHKEKPQAYTDYTNYNKLTDARKTICIQPFSTFNDEFLKKLQQFCSAFYFDMAVEILPAINFKQIEKDIRNRQNYGRQYLAQDILEWMKKKVPGHAYAMLGITLQDIYPGKQWNFVYGWAYYKARVGIFSFIRWDQQAFQDRTKEVNWQLILYPSLRTMVHETGHMFFITHCVYHYCIMCGFNCIQQNYDNPFQLCPVDLRKLLNIFSRGKLKARYELMITLLRNWGVGKQDVIFYQKLIKICDEANKGGISKVRIGSMDRQVISPKAITGKVVRGGRAATKPRK